MGFETMSFTDQRPKHAPTITSVPAGGGAARGRGLQPSQLKKGVRVRLVTACQDLNAGVQVAVYRYWAAADGWWVRCRCLIMSEKKPVLRTIDIANLSAPIRSQSATSRPPRKVA